MKKSDIIDINPNTGNILTRKDVEAITGTVSVNIDSSITPTTRENIRKVDANQWVDEEYTVVDLQDQLAILSARQIAAYEMGNYNVVQQIGKGIAQLQFILKTRTDDDFTLI